MHIISFLKIEILDLQSIMTSPLALTFWDLGLARLDLD